jgi:hypothetical protein
LKIKQRFTQHFRLRYKKLLNLCAARIQPATGTIPSSQMHVVKQRLQTKAGGADPKVTRSLEILILVSLTSEGQFTMTTNSFLNEAIYLAANPAVAAAVAAGQYASGVDEYLQVGQFQERNGVVFNGTNDDDTIQSSGQNSAVVGVDIANATVGRRLINIVANSQFLWHRRVRYLTGLTRA